MDENQLRAWAGLLDKRGLEWELYGVDAASTNIEVREGEVDAFKSSRTQGVAVRIRENERMGFSFSTSLDADSFTRMVEQARAAGAALEPNEFASLTTVAGPTADLELVDEGGLQRPVEEKIEAARAIEAAARAADERVKRVRKASYSESDGREWLLNSHGVFRQARATFYSASVLAIAEADGQRESGGEFQFGRDWKSLDFGWIGREAASRATGQLGARGMPTARLNVVFENRVVADLLGVLSSSFLGESVQRNRSLLAGKLGEAIMAPLVTIVDDGLDVRGAGAFPFDGEGIPHQRTPLVSGGVLEGYLYDIETGARDRRPSTGNSGRSGFRSPPGPGTTNLRLEPGEGTAADLCAQAGNGFLVTDLMGLHTANPISGEFSLGAAGFEIVNGKLGDPIRGVAVADNVLGLFRRATRVAGDFRYFGSIGSASMLVPEVSVSGG